MPNTLLTKKDGTTELVPEERLGEAAASGEYDPSQTVHLRNAQGNLVETTLERVPQAVDATPIGVGEREQMAREAELERRHGGATGTAGALVEGGIRGLTLGGSDLLGITSTPGGRARREVHPLAAGAGEIGGMVLPALATGGVGGAAGAAARGGRIAQTLRATPAGMAARAGESIAARGGAGRAAAGYGLEGAIFGVGEGVTELAHSEDPVTVERAAATLGASALLGGGIGAGAGLAGKALGKALNRTSKQAREAAEQARRAPAPDAAGGVADEVAEYHQRLGSVFEEAAPPGSEPRGILGGTAKRKRSILDNPVGLARRPGQVMDPLERDATALQRLVDESDEILGDAAKRDASAARAIRESLEQAPDGRVRLHGAEAQQAGDFIGKKIDAKTAKRKKGVTFKPEDARRYAEAVESGQIHARRTQALNDEVPELLRRNQALQDSIQATIDAQKSAGQVGMGQEMVERGISSSGLLGGLAFGGPAGAIVGASILPRLTRKIGDTLSGRMAKANTEVAERMASALDKVTRAADKPAAAPPLANKILGDVQYGPPGKDDDAPPPEGDDGRLLASFRKRAKELRSQTALSPQGQIVMRPAARRQVADQLAGVAAASPRMADMLETQAARQVEFLASKLPKKPDAMATNLGGEDTWRPSGFEMRKFGRYAAAVEDPVGALERLADGTISPEDIDAVREVYPEMYNEARAKILNDLADGPAPPFSQRVVLSLFLGAPIDPSMSPEVIRRLQAGFDSEPGTEGGSAPPTPQPAFGSVKATNPTPSQDRAG